MSIDLPGSNTDLVKPMHVGNEIKTHRMFDHAKCLNDWTTLACYVYNNEYCKVL